MNDPTPPPSARSISRSAVVPAAPQAVFDLLADPAMHPLLDGSGTVKACREGNPSRLALGAEFNMGMRNKGFRYRVQNTVVAFVEGRTIAWRNMNHTIWRYDLEPVEGGTKVTETWDWGPVGPAGVLFRLGGFMKDNTRGIEATLQRLEAHFKTV
jgi:hypothetical protein